MNFPEYLKQWVHFNVYRCDFFVKSRQGYSSDFLSLNLFPYDLITGNDRYEFLDVYIKFFTDAACLMYSENLPAYSFSIVISLDARHNGNNLFENMVISAEEVPAISAEAKAAPHTGVASNKTRLHIQLKHVLIGIEYFANEFLKKCFPEELETVLAINSDKRAFGLLLKHVPKFLVSERLVSYVKEKHPELEFAHLLWLSYFNPSLIAPYYPDTTVAAFIKNRPHSLDLLKVARNDSRMANDTVNYVMLVLASDMPRQGMSAQRSVREWLIGDPELLAACKQTLHRQETTVIPPRTMSTLFKPAAQIKEQQHLRAEAKTTEWEELQHFLFHFSDKSEVVNLKKDTGRALLEKMFARNPILVLQTLTPILNERVDFEEAKQGDVAAPVRKGESPGAIQRAKMAACFLVTVVLQKFKTIAELKKSLLEKIPEQEADTLLMSIKENLRNELVLSYMRLEPENVVFLGGNAQWLLENISHDKMSLPARSFLLFCAKAIYEQAFVARDTSDNAFLRVRAIHEFLVKGRSWKDIQTNIAQFPYYEAYLARGGEKIIQQEEQRTNENYRHFEAERAHRDYGATDAYVAAPWLGM